ncbi:MAG TPA: hypothetical protein VME66_06920 [Candidatus Acidoferrales bacterium]|nr:hypothetical protein [Candidatus Acidoferrales bacterium]
MKWICVFVVAVWMTPISASADATRQTVNLTVVSSCGVSVVLGKATMSTDNGYQVDVPLARVGAHFYAGHAGVAPGRYHVGVPVIRGATPRSDCWGGTEVTVLPGHDRDVGIQVVTLGEHYDAHAFLNGTLPFPGFVRGSLIGKSYDSPVEIDDGAYFVEHQFPGRYLLKLSYGDSLECRIAVVIPEQGMRFDVSVQRAQECLGFPYHYPSTGERGFVRLFPSPSPSSTAPEKQ